MDKIIILLLVIIVLIFGISVIVQNLKKKFDKIQHVSTWSIDIKIRKGFDKKT